MFTRVEYLFLLISAVMKRRQRRSAGLEGSLVIFLLVFCTLSVFNVLVESQNDHPVANHKGKFRNY